MSDDNAKKTKKEKEDDSTSRFLTKTAETGLLKFLQGRDRHTAILCQGEVFEELRKELAGKTEATLMRVRDASVETLGRDDSRFKTVYVLSFKGYKKVLARIREFNEKVAVYNLINRVMINLACGVEAHEEFEGKFPDTMSATRSYAILCTARSGSTMLCDHLIATGQLGYPKEHLRPWLLHMQRNRANYNFAFGRWLGVLTKKQSSGDFFATKIIAHFLANTLEALNDEEKELIKSVALRTDARLIYLVRRDKVAQAISDYMAANVKVWHVRDESKLDEYQKKKQEVEYDFEEILRRYRHFRRMEAKLKSFIDGTGRPVHLMCYEDLVEQPVEQLCELARFLGVSEDLFKVERKSTLIRTSDDKNADFARRFRADLAAQGLE